MIVKHNYEDVSFEMMIACAPIATNPESLMISDILCVCAFLRGGGGRLPFFFLLFGVFFFCCGGGGGGGGGGACTCFL